MPAVRVQLALQGGGAKICSLMAVMEAVEKLQKEGVIKVTRIAGTSAGAIVGCIFAAGVSMDSIRQLLLGADGKALLKEYRPRSSIGFLFRALFQKEPAWSTESLHKLLTKILENTGCRILADLKKVSGIEMLVMAADLTTSGRITCGSNESIVQAMLDSAGLPYLFRIWSRDGSAVRVDGGICENLPVGELLAHVRADGAIAAVSFDRSEGPSPKDIKTFTMAILDAAINNSMARARGALNTDDILSIKTKIGTFDFEKAFSDGLRTDYESQKDIALGFFRDFAVRHSQAFPGNPWEEQNPVAVTLMQRLGEVYYSQFAKNLCRFTDCQMVVSLNSLVNPGKGEPQRDMVEFKAKFEPQPGQPIQCLSIGIRDPVAGSSHLSKTTCKVTDPKGTVVKLTSIPIKNPKEPNQWELVYFFDPVLTSGPYTLTFVDEIRCGMEGLLKEGRDDLQYFPRRAYGPVGRIRLVLRLPMEFNEGLRLVSSKMSCQEGRVMEEAELDDIRDQPDWVKHGWVGENVSVTPESDRFRVDVYAPKCRR